MNLSEEKHKFALARNYFDTETEFDDDAEPLLYQYTCAAFKAAVAAKRYVAHNDPEELANARWYEAVAQTLEQVLLSYSTSLSIEFSFPFPPGVRT